MVSGAVRPLYGSLGVKGLILANRSLNHFLALNSSPQTYCVDSQVADSACSATAYLGGVKTNIGTIGVTGHVKVDDCDAMNNASNRVSSILKWSQVNIFCSGSCDRAS